MGFCDGGDHQEAGFDAIRHALLLLLNQDDTDRLDARHVILYASDAPAYLDRTSLASLAGEVNRAIDALSTDTDFQEKFEKHKVELYDLTSEKAHPQLPDGPIPLRAIV